MCQVCGCSGNATHEHDHVHGDGHDHIHGDGHSHSHSHGDGHSHSHDHAHSHGRARLIRVEQDLLAHNDRLAAQNRRRFEEDAVLALNLMSSPGAGKTTLLVKTLERLRGRLPMAVIEGDQQTSLDADRIRATGTPAVQINTGKGCHLDAEAVGEAARALSLPRGAALFIENVGNLVCPAGFDLGEARRVVLVSVTEGDDKPLKYPNMFAACDLVLITKMDLLPHLDLDLARLKDNARRIRPGVEILEVSAKEPAGLAPWLSWLAAQVARERPELVVA